MALMGLRRTAGGQSSRDSRMAIGIAVGILVGCICTLLLPGDFFSYALSGRERCKDIKTSSPAQAISSPPDDSSKDVSELRTQLSLFAENAELKKQIKELTSKLENAEQLKNQTNTRQLVTEKRNKAGPFGTVKAGRTNPLVLPNESVNPRLAKLLKEIAVGNELIVALSNSGIMDILELWFRNIQRLGISNYLVVALDDQVESMCRANGVPVYRRDPDKRVDRIGRKADSHAVSSLKFRILREFLELGYSVLLSDVDIVYLRNPFEHLHRDCDVEAMSDGYDNYTAYGYDEGEDDPPMGYYARFTHTIRLWMYNSGFVYIRPTIPAIELLDRVTAKLGDAEDWDQKIFNEELHFPSSPGYEGLHASRRTMDMYLFMNSKVLFKHLRNDKEKLAHIKPVVVHVNFHRDKTERMEAIVQYYVEGKENALDALPVGSPTVTEE